MLRITTQPTSPSPEPGLPTQLRVLRPAVPMLRAPRPMFRALLSRIGFRPVPQIMAGGDK